ncbi:protein of unknown function [Haloechinothrix alba]|uniref:DUF222 domain-containing protein n=1 Tax=Haloechinothrix alba TaxID=664784 RepID=A0A238WT95_9PSEU|nr:HNH endonuclease signature motif containing protein [Haloechinothrix alba]SNR49750.1 protein of unknown function [Haloechinothrix alba]
MITSGDVALPEPGTEWWRASPDELMRTLQRLEVLQRQAAAVQGEILADIAGRGVMDAYGYGTLHSLVRDVLRVDAREARQREARAMACNPVCTGIRETPAPCPRTGQALREGVIGQGHVDALRETLEHLPGSATATEYDELEHRLLARAEESGPAQVRTLGRRLLARFALPGDPLDDSDLAQPQRELLLGWRRDGRLAFSGTLDAESGKALEAALSPLAKPQPSEDGTRDERSCAQRHGDALADLIGLTLAEGRLPTEGSEKPRLVVTIPLGELSSDGPPTATGLLNQDVPVTAEQARRLACDAGVIPAVLGTKGEVLDLGREQRLVSTAQRRALALRDSGCVFPGCGRPERWCHAHHIEHWVHGGPTDLGKVRPSQ